MACDVRSTNIALEAANVSWGQEEKTCITPATGLAGGEYFKISSPTTSYVVWTSVNAVGADPAVAGYTSVEVAVGTAYTVSEWITAFIAALEAELEHLVAVSTDGLSCAVTDIYVGTVLETVTDEDTGFTFTVTTTGFGGSLGKTKDAIEISFESESFEVLSNQTGSLLLDKLLTGTKASLSMSLLEMTRDRWGQVVGNGYGDSYTPSAGTEVYGFGTSKINTSVFDSAGKLVLHPVRLDDTDKSRDVVFWKTSPMPDSINYDGTDSQAMSVTFEALVDDEITSEVSLFAFGDWTQDLRG